MFKSVAKVLVPAMVLAAGAVIVPLATTASAAPRSFNQCMDFLVGGHDVDPWLAHDACDAFTTQECYWILRDEYVPAVIAMHGCRLADD